MSLREKICWALILVGGTLALGSLMWYSIHLVEDCKARGGEYLRTTTGYACVKVERLK